MNKKQKNIALIIGFVIALVLCYQLAISNTLQQKEQYNTLKAQELLFKNAPKQLSLLKQKEVYYDSLLSKYQLDGSSIQNNLLKVINTFANHNNLKVVSFLEPHVISKNDLTINTYEFILEGNYNAIIQLIHQLEQKTKFGEVINLHFEKKKNFRSGTFYLQVTILLQSFG
tara:strand:+ start:6877 stop:7389 length:513 start_codon:yes stop_codon:yes gene_type:complete